MTKEEAMKQAKILVTVLLTDDVITKQEAEILRQALEQPDAIEAAIKAENEACAFIASKEAQQWEYPSHANAAAVSIADAIRARMR